MLSKAWKAPFRKNQFQSIGSAIVDAVKKLVTFACLHLLSDVQKSMGFWHIFNYPSQSAMQCSHFSLVWLPALVWMSSLGLWPRLDNLQTSADNCQTSEIKVPLAAWKVGLQFFHVLESLKIGPRNCYSIYDLISWINICSPVMVIFWTIQHFGH